MKKAESQDSITYNNKTYQIVLDNKGLVWFVDPKFPNQKNNFGQLKNHQIMSIDDAKKYAKIMLEQFFLAFRY